jgi:hypothetical protein
VRARVLSELRRPAHEGLLDEHPEGISHVSADLVEPGAMTIGADTFFGLFNAAEFEHRQAARFRQRQSVAHCLGSRHVDKCLEFIVQALLSLSPIENPPQDRHEPT